MTFSHGIIAGIIVALVVRGYLVKYSEHGVPSPYEGVKLRYWKDGVLLP